MKYLAITVLSLIVAVLLGHFISDDAGFVVIGYGGKVFRTSFVFFVILLGAGLTALYLVWRILYQVLTLKTRWLGWAGEYRRKRSQRALSNGLMALAEGDFGRAEQLLSRGADNETTPALYYLGAAEAAQAQNAVERRDNYLSLAREAMPSAEAAIGIKRAEMQLNNRQYEQARATLDFLADRHPDNKQILSLQHRTYVAVGDSRALLALLPALRRYRVFEPERLKAYEADIAHSVMSRTYASLEELNAVWNLLPKSAREQAPVTALYTLHLALLGFDEQAEKILRKALARHWHGDLLRRYSEVHIQNRVLQLERAEAWRATHTDDPDLWLCLAKLSIAATEWDKARGYLQRLIEVAPSPLAYQLLAEVHEQADEFEAAHRCQRDGLALATNAAGGLPIVMSQ